MKIFFILGLKFFKIHITIGNSLNSSADIVESDDILTKLLEDNQGVFSLLGDKQNFKFGGF